MSDRSMNPMRQRFVSEYLIDLNATQAAIRAGYSARTASVKASQLLKHPAVAKELEAAQKKRAARVEIDQDYVVNNLAEVVERCMQRAPVLEFDRNEKCYVQATDGDGKGIWQFDARNAVAALNTLAKHTGGFSDRHELSGPDGGPIEVVDANALRKQIAGRIAGIASRIGAAPSAAPPVGAAA